MTKKKVLNYIRENRMIEAGSEIVVGVSGGADSMCLLDILLSLRDELCISLKVVHIHHGIRKETADRDQSFVERFCEERKVPCEVKRYDIPKLASQWGMSHEEAGRRVRYEAFEDSLKASSSNGMGRIAVAHNADDNVETVLLNLFRGTGLKGMTGIRPVRDNVIRPLLCLSREEIEDYNRDNDIKYVQDETNLEEEYTRNKVRLSVLPKLKEINNQVVQHINMTADGLTLIDDYIASEVSKHFADVVEVDEASGTHYIRESGFVSLHQAMQLEIVKRCLYNVAGKAKDITKQHIDSVVELFQMTVGKRICLPYGMVAIRQYEGVSVIKEQVEDKGFDKADAENMYCINAEGGYDIHLAGQTMKITVKKDTFSSEIFEENRYTKWIECDIMKCSLQVRTRRNGDYIVVDDKGSKKKLKDFFIDKKVPKEDRDRIVVVANGSEIVWIVGYRLSSAYKVLEGSRNILKIQIDL